MKKATLLACACAMLVGAQSLVAQENAVTYVSDPTQGVLVNRMQDNWFLTVDGGINMSFDTHDAHHELSHRIAPSAGIYVGKWFSPVFGGRVGVSYNMIKGLGSINDNGALIDQPLVDGYYKTKMNDLGPMFDVMLNLTNWWCGYKPGRVYEGVLYVGAGNHFQFGPKYENGKRDGLMNYYNHNSRFTLRAGLINYFNVSKHFAISLDIRYSALAGRSGHRNLQDAAALLGFTYKFNNTTWEAPVVPVCPEPENCDALRERLSAADNRICNLEDQLRRALARTPECPACEVGPLATVYFPIGVSQLSRENQRVVRAIASVMNSDRYANSNFTITGWADNYTGTDAINARLRTRRAESVRNLLVRNGVNADRLEVTTDANNLMGEGSQYVALDRAVTINEK